MTTPLLSLFAFAGLTAALLLGVVGYRSALVLSGRAGPNDFPSGTPHGPPAYWRLYRAHQNAVENLVLFGVIVLGAHAAGLVDPWFDRLAVAVVIGRALQAALHVGTTSALFGYLRFTAFVGQLAGLAGIAALALGLRAG